MKSELVTSPLPSRCPHTKVTKSELVASPLSSWGPTGGRICYATPAFLGVANEGDKMRIDYLTFAFSGGHKWAALLRNPCILGGLQKGDEVRIGSLTLAFSGAHRWAELLRNPCILGRHMWADLLILHSWVSPTKETKSE